MAGIPYLWQESERCKTKERSLLQRAGDFTSSAGALGGGDTCCGVSVAHKVKGGIEVIQFRLEFDPSLIVFFAFLSLAQHPSRSCKFANGKL